MSLHLGICQQKNAPNVKIRTIQIHQNLGAWPECDDRKQERSTQRSELNTIYEHNESKLTLEQFY